MSKKSLILQLTILSSQMEKAADAINKLYPDLGNAKELKGAAGQVLEWSNDIQQEILEEIK